MQEGNGRQVTYQYDELNRLTNMSLAHLAAPIAGYAYALNPSGHRTQVRELGGRTASYGYDNLYRLTQETISGSIIAGQITYTYDAVGNRLGRNSTVTNILEKLYDYDMNDRSGSDSYDAAGNTVDAELTINHQQSALSFAYDFENRITSATSAVSVVQILYDGDGNRVAKTVTDGMGSRRTWFLVDDRNLTGYSQVLAELGTWNLELGTGAVTRAYTYGLDLISQARYTSLIAEHSFYGYDGHGNVRCLTDTNGYITDTYDYDAFGTLIEQKAWDPNAFALVPVSTDNRSLVTDNLYLYCGEQFDPDLGLYFLRARYMDTDRGRFWTMDAWQGMPRSPLSLHRYLYANSDPVSFGDPSGQRPTLTEVVATTVIIGVLATSIIEPKLPTDGPCPLGQCNLWRMRFEGTAGATPVGVGVVFGFATLEACHDCKIFPKADDYWFFGAAIGVGTIPWFPFDVSFGPSWSPWFSTACIKWREHNGLGRITSVSLGLGSLGTALAYVTTPQTYQTYTGWSYGVSPGAASVAVGYWYARWR